MLQRVVSIRFLIIVVVVVLVVAASLITWMTQHFLVTSGINDLSDSIRYLVRMGVDYQVTAVLEAGKSVALVDNGTFTYAIHNASLAAREPYFKHLYRLIQSTNSIGAISFINVLGDNIGCRRVSTYDPISNFTTTDYSYYTQYSNDSTFSIYSYEVEPDTIDVGALIFIEFNFSALLRPWYIDATRSTSGNYVWSNIYLNAQVLTETVAQPFFSDSTDALPGVLGVHLFLPRLKESLTNLTAYGGSRVILVTSDGRLIIDSCAINTRGDPITCPGLLSASSSPSLLRHSGGVYARIDADVMLAFGSWANVTSGRTVTLGEFWVTFQMVMDQNLRWTAVIMIDSNVYLQQVERANTYTIVGISVFSVVAAVAAGLAGVAVTRPISRTITQMDRISTMDFSKKHHRRSWLYEINAMEKSLSRLRTALCSFEKFVPNRVIKEILSQDIEAHLGVTPCYATVFFCDIEDFTTIAELMDPANLVALLLDFLQEMSNVILEETQGTIDKFIGDAIMAFWNAPHPVENHAEMACVAAMRCHHKISTDLGPKWANLGLPEGIRLNARFGIHTGDMLIGNIGSLERINYTAIGDNVNIASRLETLCKFYQVRILISANTYQLVRGRFLCRPLDMVVVKGKSQSLILYELVNELEDALPEQRRLCSLQEMACNFVFAQPDPDRAMAAYDDLHTAYPNDVSISRVMERLQRFYGTEKWPGMEVFDHK